MGLKIQRLLTSPDKSPYDDCAWERRDVAIKDASGKVIAERLQIEAPEFWSQSSVDVAATHYLRKAGGPNGGPETSIRQLIARVVNSIANYGASDEYFATPADREAFADELACLLIDQYGAFNSPVWFNCGLYYEYGTKSNGGNWVKPSDYADARQIENNLANPQCSACFIQSVEDSLDGLHTLLASEARLFKYGSGTGTNFSSIRSKHEKLSGGGTSSGLMSFLEVFDRSAGATKSGGSTRRAAKMVCLNIDHPEIVEFITWKVREEKKAQALIAAGYESDFNGDAYHTVSGQNSNNSVRVSNEFMAHAAYGPRNPDRRAPHVVLKARTTEETVDTISVGELWDTLVDAAWQTGDPALQFDDTINEWHTCPEAGRINASNPCSEYMFLDDSACNLASLNLVKFTKGRDVFNVALFTHAVRIFTIAMDIIVGMSSYPTKKIAENSYDYRPLGLGYANLGSMFMRWGYPYDSAQARTWCGEITALMTGAAYLTSIEMAKEVGRSKVAESKAMAGILQKHWDAYKDSRYMPGEKKLEAEVTEVWDAVLNAKALPRNAQVTVLAPTGTIGLFMGCDTTGIEPDFSLVKLKKLAGGGEMRMVNSAVEPALRRLGYDGGQCADIVAYVEANNTVHGAPHILREHLSVFDCAVGREGEVISPLAHLGMMAAAQPFLSGAISKTVNLPANATREDVSEIYKKAWKWGLKSIAVYRDGCKASQPLNAAKAPEKVPVNELMQAIDGVEEQIKLLGKVSLGRTKKPSDEKLSGEIAKTLGELAAPFTKGLGAAPRKAIKEPLPNRRHGTTIKVKIDGQTLFLRTGEYPDGRLGEVFLDMHRQGSTVNGFMGVCSILLSVGLQHGIPLAEYADKLRKVRFEPAGLVEGDYEIKFATSIIDYVMHRLRLDYEQVEHEEQARTEIKGDGPPCDVCGSITVRSGACYRCTNCGNSLGCS